VIEREIFARPIVRAAFAVLALCALLAAWTFMNAIRTQNIAEAAPVPFDASGLLAPPPARSSINLAGAVENDVFSPDRAAPTVPYKLPGEDDPAARVAPTEIQPPVVVGTGIVGDGHNFAICQLAGGQPMTIRVGDHLGEFTVKTIERGRVVFTTPSGKLLDISASKTGT
jgi:hypothetical protein